MENGHNLCIPLTHVLGAALTRGDSILVSLFIIISISLYDKILCPAKKLKKSNKPELL